MKNKFLLSSGIATFLSTLIILHQSFTTDNFDFISDYIFSYLGWFLGIFAVAFLISHILTSKPAKIAISKITFDVLKPVLLEIFNLFLAPFIGIGIVALLWKIGLVWRIPGSDELGVGTLVTYLIAASLIGYGILRLVEKFLAKLRGDPKEA